MASSKSIRASMLPSSLSLSSLHLSSAESDLESHKNSSRQGHRQTSSLDQVQTPPVQYADDFAEPVPPPKLARKSKTWSNRLTSLLPSLTSSSTEQNILRKPIGHNRDSRDAPTEPPPPPPYDIETETRPSNIENMRKSFMPDSRTWQPELATTTGPQHDTLMPPFLHTPIPDSSFSEAPNVQIMPPIPPSPEVKRATLTKQQPAARLPPSASLPEFLEGAAARTEPRKAGKLSKENHDSTGRPMSTIGGLPQGMSGRSSPASDLRGRTASAQFPPGARTSTSNSRVASTPVTSRPISHDGSRSPTRDVKVRRSWLPGGRSRSNSIEIRNENNSAAWVMSDGSQAEYNPSFLKNAEKVPELWNESGDVLVYLFPKSSGCGPSFKVHDYTVRSSFKFMDWIAAEQQTPATSRSRARSFDGRGSLSVDDAARLASPASPPLPERGDGQMRLYLRNTPTSMTEQLAPPERGSAAEMDRLIAIRNLFAFLTGQPLVGTKAGNTVFKVFLHIAALLQEFEFTGEDGSSFGGAVDLSFNWSVDQLGLADCRHSREKTLEALILGERMRSEQLYNEAFTHAAGKHQAIMELQLPLYELVSPHTHRALESAKIEVMKRQANLNQHLEQFDFPSLFAGVASSTSATELKSVRFKVWRSSFNKMRQLVMGYYKTTFGNWPPRASSKKNPFAESGLNRLVLKVLYSDMCALYDMLVDRTALTSRGLDKPVDLVDEAGKMSVGALHAMLSESDRSRPPVLPPIPFDLPQMPSMTTIVPNFNSLPAKEQVKSEKKIKENELLLILNKAYNFDTSCIKLPFLEEFKEFETREARGKMVQDLVDQRIGYWLFLYVVIQSLPPLVVDAPGLNFTEGTEYFLCRPPMGNPPWFPDQGPRFENYQVDGTSHTNKLNPDVMMFGHEATYYRSHCWLAAKRWEGVEGAEAPPPEEPAMSPLAPPRAMFQGGGDPLIPAQSPVLGQSTPSPPLGGPQMAIRPRNNLSPASNRSSSGVRSSVIMGLTPVPLEPPVGNPNHYRSSSMGPPAPLGQLGGRSASAGNLAGMNTPDSRGKPSPPAGNPMATFDDILGGSQTKDTGKKKSRFF